MAQRGSLVLQDFRGPLAPPGPQDPPVLASPVLPSRDNLDCLEPEESPEAEDTME